MKKINKKTTIFILALLVISIGHVYANNKSMYIWKDKNGVTQYSDKAPLNIAETDVKEISLAKKEEKPQEELEASNTPQMAPEGENEACIAARKNLEMLKNETMGILVPDASEKTGKRIMNAEERKTAKDKAEAQIVAFCVN